ncbi:Anamorsin [Acropora cervicornis]|uniref:Anamorsin homolog n=1 Tax=Acropora cervicornis TaxID=6130 RepID=A0AAD9UUG6_ACRCE|nr:Anamorsin [Acropora cervicornis]
MFKEVKEGQKVLLIWSGNAPAKHIEEIVHQLKSLTGTTGNVALEHEERLLLSSHPDSSFDVVFSGEVFPSFLVHSIDILAEIARILKPNGQLTLRELTGTFGDLRSQQKLISALKLAGFVNISEVRTVTTYLKIDSLIREMIFQRNLMLFKMREMSLKSTSKNYLLLLRSRDHYSLFSKFQVSAFKPVFEVGTSSQLSVNLLPKPGEAKDATVAKIWTLSAQDIDDDEIDVLDSDTLLDEMDLLKPDPASLKSISIVIFTCGLADEIEEQGKEPVKKTVTSSCGSCYLGDAFRCASCPYLGMPAFKPGEKVALTSRQLKGDL